MREDGILVLLNTDTLFAEQTPNGSIQLTLQTPEGKSVLTGSHLLVAAGRIPNTDRLSPEAAGIETDKRGSLS